MKVMHLKLEGHLYESICNSGTVIPTQLTTDPNLVTCYKCIKVMAKLKKENKQ
jgi:hypothetical protein